MNTSHTNLVNYAAIKAYHNKEFHQNLVTNKDSYFSPPGADNNNAFKISKFNICVTFHGDDALYDYKPLVVSSITKLNGPEVGLPDFADIQRELYELGENEKVIETIINNVIVENTIFQGVSMEDVTYNPNTPSSDRTFAVQYHGTVNYTNFSKEMFFQGQRMEYCLISREKLQNYNPLYTQRASELTQGQTIFTLRPHKTENLIENITLKLKTYFKHPNIHRVLYSPNSLTGTAVTASCYEFEQFSKVNGLMFLYSLMKTTDLRFFINNQAPGVSTHNDALFNPNETKPVEYMKKELLLKLLFNTDDAGAIPVNDITSIMTAEPEDIILALAVMMNVITPSGMENGNSPTSLNVTQRLQSEREINGPNSELLKDLADFNKDINEFMFEGILEKGYKREFGIDIKDNNEYGDNKKAKRYENNFEQPDVSNDYGIFYIEQMNFIQRFVAYMNQMWTNEKHKVVGRNIKAVEPNYNGFCYLDTH